MILCANCGHDQNVHLGRRLWCYKVVLDENEYRHRCVCKKYVEENE